MLTKSSIHAELIGDHTAEAEHVSGKTHRQQDDMQVPNINSVDVMDYNSPKNKAPIHNPWDQVVNEYSYDGC